MQTILGANGQIGEELARELHRNFTTSIRIVSRTAIKVNPTDELFSADLSNLEQTIEAVKGSEIAYFTLGLPISSELWEEQFPLILSNVIEACKIHDTKLVYFDNTYMYPQNNEIQKEDMRFEPNGRKGKVRAKMTKMLLDEMNNGSINAVICRAPEFYGPDKTQSITNTLIFDAIKDAKKLKVPLRDNTLRSLIWTPDASRATALIGNTPDAYGQTWHLPTDRKRITYKQFIALSSEIYNKQFKYKVLPQLLFNIGSKFNKKLKEVIELLPRYKYDNLFDSSKFRNRFPEFRVTSYEEGIRIISEQK